MKKLKIYILFSIIIASLFNSCIEPIDVETATFEDVLVVTAIITNEYKIHQIKLTNSYRFDEGSRFPETNALVAIQDDTGKSIPFHETSGYGIYGINGFGLYESDEPFKAEPGIDYKLIIVKADGKTYESAPTPLTHETKIDAVYAERSLDALNNDGIQIFVDSYDATGNSKYYKYEFEETYKIVAPNWVSTDMIVSSSPPFSYNLELKTYRENACYNSSISNDIIQTETTDLLEDRVQKFSVRFIPRTNPIISHRYSILVKQYVQSLDAYTYYKTLKKMSTSQSGLTQNQPGFIQGNIYAVDDPNEKVIGIFEVSSVSEKRMFFNYLDFYPNQARPAYFVPCETSTPSTLYFGGASPPPFQNSILNGASKYFSENPNYPNSQNDLEGPFLVVPTPCGDCTRLGTSIKPDFWYE